MVVERSFQSAQTIVTNHVSSYYLLLSIVCYQPLLKTNKLYHILFSCSKRNLRKAKYLQECEDKILEKNIFKNLYIVF